MKNFDFLNSVPEFETLYRYCDAAENYQLADPERSAVASRKALEYMVNPTLLRSDDFFLYVTDRATRIFNRIEKAMGKTVSGRDSEETKREFVDALLRQFIEDGGFEI